MKTNDPFLMGVNYWPRRKAMYWWSDFDGGEVAEEFAMIRELGLTHVRLFLLWESFQPEPDRIDSRALGNLRSVCDLAADVGLKLQPTFFTGHMSGPNWAPDWMLSDAPRPPEGRPLVSLSRRTPSPKSIFNIYTEPFVIKAEELQLRTICGELRDHPAVWAWSLGNEPDLFCQPPTALAGQAWVARMVETIRKVDPIRPVLIGLHGVSLHADVGFRIDQIAQVTDISVMHGYSIYDRTARHPLDPDYVPFTCALTAALAGRGVLYEEFGLCTHIPNQPSSYRRVPLPFGVELNQFFSSEEDGAEFYRQVLPRLQRVGGLGAFAWCFADYIPELWDRPPCDFFIHERSFGLFRADGSLKPVGEAVGEFAKTRPTIRDPERTITLPISPDAYYQDPAEFLRPLYENFGTLKP